MRAAWTRKLARGSLPDPPLRRGHRHRPQDGGASPSSGAAWTPPYAGPGSPRCAWTWPRTSRSPRPPSRSGSASPAPGTPDGARRGHRARRHPPARRLRPRPAPVPQQSRSGPRSRGCSGTRPRRGPRRAGSGWAASARAPVSVWRMTSDQAPVLWPFIATPGLPPTGAQMGIDVLSGGSFYARPLRMGPARRHPRHQPQRHLLRQTRPRQVRHHQGVHPADDGLRVPHPGPGRPQGRVRTPVHSPGGPTIPDRTRPARPDQPAGVRTPGRRLGPPGRRSRPKPGPRSCSGAG